MHPRNCFVTLTYNDQHLPENNCLRYRDFQLFLKRLRKHFANRLSREGKRPATDTTKLIRFYMAGEYGDRLGRPHYHACLFGVDFDDKIYLRTTPAGGKIYRSPTLEKLWTLGFSSVAELTYEAAAYVARYVMKKITGQKKETHYTKVNTTTGEIYKQIPEFNKMSTRPGIGSTWLKRYTADVYPHGVLIIKGRKTKPPRYYDKIHEREHPLDHEQLQLHRQQEAAKKAHDNTPQRLKAKELVLTAKLKRLKRHID